jgi:hypothetical protein
VLASGALALAVDLIEAAFDGQKSDRGCVRLSRLGRTVGVSIAWILIASVAPTFPAPPTTVTFRFIETSCR